MQQSTIGEWMAIVSLVASASGMGLVALALAIFIPIGPSIIPGLIDDIRYSSWYPFPPTWDHAAAGIALASLALLAWALRGRRPRGQRCPRCTYDLSDLDRDNPTGRCPECGRTVKGPKDWRRRRRRWRTAAAAVFALLLAWPAFRFDEMRERGLVAGIPTPILFLLVDDLSGPRTTLRSETTRRVEHEAPAFLRRFGLRREYIGTAATARDAVKVRDRWVAGLPVIVQLGHTGPWFRSDCWSHLNIQLSEPSAPDRTATLMIDGPNRIWGLPSSDFWARRDRLILDPPALGPNTTELRLAAHAASGVIARHDITLELEGVESIDDILTPIPDPTIADRLRQQLSIGAVRREKAAPHFQLWFHTRPIVPAGQNGTPGQWDFAVSDVCTPYPGMAFGIRIDLMLDDTVVATGWEVWTQSTPMWLDEVEMTPVDDELFRITPSDAPRWRVRISTDEAAALSAHEATSYWRGEITLPVEVTDP